MKLKKTAYLNVLGFCSMSVFMIIGITLLASPQISSSNALDCGGTECGDGYTMSKASTSLSAEVASVVSLSTTAAVNVDIVPKSTGSFASSTTKVRVNTNNTSGFSVYMQTVGDNNDLVSSDKTITASINPVAANTPAESFGANTWGYKLTTSGDTVNTYNPVSTTATNPILKEDRVSVASGNTYDLTFGINIDTTLPAGQYTNSVLLSAVANPITITSLYQLTYMQDMTSDICNNTKDYVDVNNYVTKQLIDLRDGKSYWVAKLADGNCWMTQNLALDLDPAKTLTSADTDVVANYTPNSKTNAVTANGTPVNQLPNNQLSWNMGKIVLATPFAMTRCEHYGSNNSAQSTDNLGAVCASSGFVNVSGLEWQANLTAQMGNYDYNASTNIITTTTNADGSTLVAADTNIKSYDAHYLIGNYYQYNAVTAGSGAKATADNANAESSICPKGWRLPISTRQTSGLPSETNEFYQLLVQYGHAEMDKYTINSNLNSHTSLISPNVNVENNPLAYPIAYVRAGIVTIAKNGYLQNAGYVTNINSATSGGNEITYSLYTSGAIVYPAVSDLRTNGATARCLAR